MSETRVERLRGKIGSEFVRPERLNQQAVFADWRSVRERSGSIQTVRNVRRTHKKSPCRNSAKGAARSAGFSGGEELGDGN